MLKATAFHNNMMNAIDTQKEVEKNSVCFTVFT